MKFPNLFKKEPKESLTSIVEKLVAEYFHDYLKKMLNDPDKALKVYHPPYPGRGFIISMVDIKDYEKVGKELDNITNFLGEIREVQSKIKKIESESFIDEVVERINRKRVNAAP